MTILNVVVDINRAFLVVDSLISEGADHSLASKVATFPDLRLVVAGSGHRAVFQYVVAVLLNGLPANTDVEDLVETLPEALGRYWTRIGATHLTAIIVVGVTPHDMIAAYLFESPAFDAKRLAPGLCLSPPLVPAPTAPSISPKPLEPAMADEVQAAEITEMPWRRLVAAAIDAVDRQLADATVPIGGHAVVTFIDAFQIHQTRLRELHE